MRLLHSEIIIIMRAFLFHCKVVTSEAVEINVVCGVIVVVVKPLNRVI